MRQIIYAVDDDVVLQELYVYSLENEFVCRCFDEGKSLFDAFSKGSPDLILLDIMLPGDDGYTILSRLKQDALTAHIPVIIVSAKSEDFSKVKGLNMGADDYITKPFGVLEMVARVKANLRKQKKSVYENVFYKDIAIDLSKYQVIVNGRPIQATLKEYNLLLLLCENAGKVQSREAIFNKIWGDSFIRESRTLDIHIKELRRKLAEVESLVSITTIRGVGYMLM